VVAGVALVLPDVHYHWDQRDAKINKQEIAHRMYRNRQPLSSNCQQD
jgi:hypothetical protein